jgi:hypothetical protein
MRRLCGARALQTKCQPQAGVDPEHLRRRDSANSTAHGLLIESAELRHVHNGIAIKSSIATGEDDISRMARV